MKKSGSILAAVLIVGMLLSACAPTQPAPAPAETAVPPAADKTSETEMEAGIFTPGTYTGTARGINQGLTVEVIVDANSIQSISVTEQMETAGICEPAIERIPLAITTYQTLAVDSISGCTITSRGVIAAVRNALEQVCTDMAALDKAASIIETPDVPFNMEADVVVVGAGAAGLSAAINALHNGARVVLLEKMARPGGTTIYSGGLLNAAESSVQDSLAKDDPDSFPTVAQLTDYWMERVEAGRESKDVDKELVKFVAEESGKSVDYMIENGVVFPGVILTTGTMPYLVSHSPQGFGPGMITALVKTFTDLGGELLCDTAVTDLLVDGNGAVIGVNAKSSGNTLTVNAKAVILATGGFDHDPELKKEYAPLFADDLSLTNPGNTGDGLKMAMELGADTKFRYSVIANAFMGLPKEYIWAGAENSLYNGSNLFVDAGGERFINEAVDYAYALNEVKRLGITEYYSIQDAAKSAIADRLVESGEAVKADTLEELASLTGMPNLAATVERYNALCGLEADEDFGKPAANLVAIAEGPFYAVRLRGGILGTIGGILTNLDAQVLKEGTPIPGLYAAGEVANGAFFSDTYPGSGSSVSMCVTFGRIAGAHAASQAKAES